MKTLSTLALAAGLGGLTLAAPATAKDKAPPANTMRLAPALVKLAGPASAALQANDAATAEPLVAQVEAAASNDGEKYVAAALRYRLEAVKAAGKTDQSALAKPLDALIANPLTPRADKARYTYQRAQLALLGKQYPVAVEYFGRARELGYTDPALGLSAVKARVDGGDVAGGTAELDRVLAEQATRGEKAPVDYYRYAIARSNKSGAAAQTVAWMTKYAAAYPTGQTWYEILTAYGLQQGATAKLDPQGRLDVYRLLRAAGGLADEAGYLEYVRTAQAAGAPQEAQAVLKEGLAAGKIPAASAEAKALGVIAAKSAAAKSPTALEAKVKTATTGVAAAQAADARLGAGEYAKAAALYQTALAKGGVDADAVNTHLGIALARSGDKAGAQAAFAAVKGAPRADLATLWTAWLNSSAG